MRSLGVEFHSWQRFKLERGDLFPYLQFGWVTFWCCKVSAREHMIRMGLRIENYQRQLAEAARELSRKN